MIVSIAAMAMLFVGCSSMMSLSTYGPNDLYRTNNRAEVAAQLKAEAEAELIAAEARRAQYEALIAQANADATEAEYYAMLNNEPSFTSVVADDYQSAYARRLYGFQSPTYNMPSSYYNMLNNSSIYYVTAYDPSYYNIMVSGDQVWVEPKYVTSMFGSWGATNVTFGIYASPWNYGWSYHVDPFYYSMWGYPRYSWYDWNWAMCYNPFYYDWYWGCYYDPFYPHHHHHHYYPGYYPMPPYPGHGSGHGPGHGPGHGHGPDYRPGHTTGSGASMGPGNLNGNRGNTGSRYTSPTTNRNYGASDNRVSSGRVTNGSTSQGFNSNSVRPSNGSSTNSRNNSVGSTRISNGTATGGSSNFRQGSSTGSSSRSTSTTVTNTNRGSSSNNRVGSSQTGSYRQSSYSGSSSSRSSSSSSSSYRSSGSSSSSRSSSYGGSSGSSSRSSSSGSGSFRSGSSSSGNSRR